MKTIDQGHQAEVAVAKKLKADGHEILNLNWRTPRCEIDIVSLKDGAVYFTEVKFRVGASQGSGFDYITPKKLRQLAFAAEMWVAENNWSGDYRLVGAEVSGLSFEHVKIVEI